MLVAKIEIGKAFEYIITLMVNNISWLTRAISDFVNWSMGQMVSILMAPPVWVMLLAIITLIYWLTNKKGLTIFAALGLLLVNNLGLWESTLLTMALIIMSTALCTVIGIPLGILAAISKPFHRVIMPVLDFMQTLPAFVYLIPAVAFFGLGPTGGLFATVIFAMPPAIRLTDLGIRQVPEELVEAADAFGSTTMQKLVKLQLPIALPAIRTGVNQTIMLSLSMVVISALIGAEGVGKDVWTHVQQLNKGLAFEAGICIVILAIIMDRTMQATGRKEDN